MEDEEKQWITEAIVDFLHSPLYSIALMEFIDEHCLIFAAEDENKLDYTLIHNQYKTLVEEQLTGFLKTIGSSPEALMEVLSRPARYDLSAFVTSTVLTVDDFLLFKAAMVKRNLDLNNQAAAMAAELGSPKATARATDTPLATNPPLTEEEKQLQAVLRLSLEESRVAGAAAEEHLKRLLKEEQEALGLAVALSLAEAEERQQEMEQAAAREAADLRLALEMSKERQRQKQKLWDGEAGPSGSSAPEEERLGGEQSGCPKTAGESDGSRSSNSSGNNDSDSNNKSDSNSSSKGDSDSNGSSNSDSSSSSSSSRNKSSATMNGVSGSLSKSTNADSGSNSDSNSNDSSSGGGDDSSSSEDSNSNSNSNSNSEGINDVKTTSNSTATSNSSSTSGTGKISDGSTSSCSSSRSSSSSRELQASGARVAAAVGPPGEPAGGELKSAETPAMSPGQAAQLPRPAQAAPPSQPPGSKESPGLELAPAAPALTPPATLPNIDAVSDITGTPPAPAVQSLKGPVDSAAAGGPPAPALGGQTQGTVLRPILGVKQAVLPPLTRGQGWDEVANDSTPSDPPQQHDTYLTQPSPQQVHQRREVDEEEVRRRQAHLKQLRDRLVAANKEGREAILQGYQASKTSGQQASRAGATCTGWTRSDPEGALPPPSEGKKLEAPFTLDVSDIVRADLRKALAAQVKEQIAGHQLSSHPENPVGEDSLEQLGQGTHYPRRRKANR